MAININYSLSQQLGQLLTEQQKKLAVAESCTGGGLAQEITAVAGCGEYFLGGLVAYSPFTKMRFLQVKADTIEAYGLASEQVAKEMVLGLMQQSEADLGVSITGIAGPSGGSLEKPVGLVCFALADRTGMLKSCTKQFTSGRKHIRRCAIGFALQWMIDALKK